MTNRSPMFFYLFASLRWKKTIPIIRYHHKLASCMAFLFVLYFFSFFSIVIYFLFSFCFFFFPFSLDCFASFLFLLFWFLFITFSVLFFENIIYIVYSDTFYRYIYISKCILQTQNIISIFDYFEIYYPIYRVRYEEKTYA